MNLHSLIHQLNFYSIFQLLYIFAGCSIFEFSDEKRLFYREKVKSMFYHAYNGYLEFAYPMDELKPITCTGQDTWGSFSLTLVDSLDMLLILGNETEFTRAVELVTQNLDVERNMNISVFETNIRIIGGLLSAHMLSSHDQRMLLPDGWPCSGPLLDLAERFAQKLLPAFNTNTGMPYGTVNLRYGVNNLETPITCTAGIGTFILEFGTLSRLTGNPHYERVALRALDSLWASRSKLGLVGNHINIQTGIFTATDSGIGAGVDSYFEYLVKGALLFQRPALMQQFYEFEEAINKNVRKEDWFMWVDKDKATVSLPIFQSLEAFWPGLLTLIGKVEDAARIMGSYGQILRHLGLPPEFYNLPNQEPVQRRAAYPLRPEIAESLMYLHRATGDPQYLQMAAGIVDVIDQMARTKCGFATVRDVTTWTLEDRMESFFLAETVKYLYLIFDSDNWMHNDGTKAKLVETTDGPCVIEAGGWIFNTEAHPLDPGIIYCCSKKRDKDRAILREFEENIDLLSLTGQFRVDEAEEEKGTENVSKQANSNDENGSEKYIEKSMKNEPENNWEYKHEIGLICEECSTLADEPEISQNVRQFWLNIYARYIQFPHFNGKICLDLNGDGQPDGEGEEAIEHQYSNMAPDLDSLRSEDQTLDAVANVSLLKFKYFRRPTNGRINDDEDGNASNFVLLTSPNRPFERNFLGIGQIVPA